MVTAELTADQLTAVEHLIDSVSERQLQDFGHISSDLKADGTLITACDRWSDAAFVEGLAEIAPGEGVLSEEGSKHVPDSRAYWVVDPLDGTTNLRLVFPTGRSPLLVLLMVAPVRCFWMFQRCNNASSL